MGYNAIISMMPKVPAIVYDPDAQLFFNAESSAGVSLTLTQKSAVNQWVVDAKAAGIWTKFKAIYPMVGGTATAHKFNLKNPADTNAAFRLSFIGGWTHSVNGALPNGINAYADSFLAPSTTLTLNSQHISFYSRTNSNGTEVEIGCNNAGTAPNTLLEIRTAGSTYSSVATGTYLSYVDANSLGLYIGNRTASNVTNLFKNNTKVVNGTTASTSNPSNTITIGALNSGFTRQFYTTKQCAFSTIGDGLTDLESQLFYQITEKYQVALSRNINTTQSFYYNSAYNNETNAFLFSTQITDNTIQTATNTLVTDLKTAGVFTKMKAIYPMVGGTATTHKFNLVNAQDSAAAFALSFVGGWTHSANGALPNGTNAYADTFLIPSTSLTLNSSHLSFYSRTNNVGNYADMGGNGTGSTNDSYFQILSKWSDNSLYAMVFDTDFTTNVVTNSLGLMLGSRTASNVSKSYRNGVIVTSKTAASISRPAKNVVIGARNNAADGILNYSNRQCAFASIGDGLTDAEVTSYYTAVQTFNTTLARQV